MKLHHRGLAWVTRRRLTTGFLVFVVVVEVVVTSNGGLA